MNQMAKSLSFFPKNKISVGKHQCKKHPKHHQSPGVCSLCLSQKLSKLSASRAGAAINKDRVRASYYSSTSSSTSYESSYDSSNAASPLYSAARHRRIVSDMYNTTANEEKGRKLFSKSKSMAHVENASNKLRRSSDNNNMLKKNKENKNVNGVSKIWANILRLGRLSNDQKRVNVEHIHSKTTLITSQPLSTSTTMVLAS